MGLLYLYLNFYTTQGDSALGTVRKQLVCKRGLLFSQRFNKKNVSWDVTPRHLVTPDIS